MTSVRTATRRPWLTGALLLAAWLVNLARWARRTRPEALPPAPVGSRTVTAADGTALHVQVGGREDADVTVVFVHGFLARTIEFDMQWQSLGTRARLVRYDHRNHGRSGHSSKPLSVDELADDLAAVLDQSSADRPVVLVGHSMGGMTVMALAGRRPELIGDRVVAVALLSTGAGHFLSGHPWENAFRWLSRRHLFVLPLRLLRLFAPVLEQFRPRRTHTLRWATRKLIFGTGDIDPATLAMTQQLLEGPPLTTVASLQGSLLRNDVLAGLKQLRQLPVLVLAGDTDRLIRPEHSVRMAADLGPDSTLVLVPGAGHVVNQTKPVEVNAALHQLLDRVAS